MPTPQDAKKMVDAGNLSTPTDQDSPSAMPPGAPGGEARERDYRTNTGPEPFEPPKPFKV